MSSHDYAADIVPDRRRAILTLKLTCARRGPVAHEADGRTANQTAASGSIEHRRLLMQGFSQKDSLPLERLRSMSFAKIRCFVGLKEG